MKRHGAASWLRSAALAIAAATIPALAQAAATQSTLYSFNTSEAPALCRPQGELIQASDENFYGVTNNSGDGTGAVYRLTPAGNLTILHDFAVKDSNGFNADGATPMSIVQGTDGKLYGTADSGGAAGQGTVFRLALDGSGFAVLHSFLAAADGTNPDAPLTEGADGNFYGVTLNGVDPSNNGGGTLFRIAPGGTYADLHGFVGASDGVLPNTRLVQGTDGNFYGTTAGEGPAAQSPSPSGTVFQFVPGTATVNALYTFGNGSDGREPEFGLALGLDGNFYGTTGDGTGSVTSPNGVIYKLTPQGAITVLHSFTEQQLTGTPYDFGPLVLGSDGNFYGASQFLTDSSTDGNVYQFTPSGQYSVLYAFNHNQGDGSNPRGGMVQGSDGSYYGIAASASAGACGTVYKLAMAPAQNPPVQISVSPAAITLGQTPAQTATLSWTVANATSQTFQRCFASGGGTGTYAADSAWSGVKAGAVTATSQVVVPTMAGVYRYALTCGGVETASTVLTVNPATPVPPTVTIAVNPTTITLGQSATLNWSSTGASSCSASGAWSGSEPVSGNLVVKPGAAGSYTYTLGCSGAGGSSSSSASLTVQPVPPPGPTVTISANPSTLILGQSSTLTWSSTNATACTASNGWSGSEPTSGNTTVTPKTTGTTTYTLTCTGSSGSATAFATVQVNPPQPTVTITVKPSTIMPGQNATLNWSSTNATACTASGAWSGSKGTSGTLGVTQATPGSYTYTLSCTGAGGTASSSATLSVIAGSSSSSSSSGGSASSSSSGGGTPPAAVNSGINGNAGAFGPAMLVPLGLLALLRRRPARLRRTLLTLPLLGAVLPSLARAEELKFDLQHAYAGLRLGEAIYAQSSDDVAARLAAQGDPVSGVSLSKHRFAGALYEGVPIWGGLGVELGLVQLGRYDARLNTSSGNLPKVTADVARALQPAGQGLTLGFGGSVPVLGPLSFDSHVAMLLFTSTQKAHSAAGTFKENKLGVGAAFSTGALYRFSNSVSAGLAFDAYYEDGSTSVYLPNVQFEYRFGP